MKENLEKLDILMEVKSWGGLGKLAGNRGTIITQDKKMYFYHQYYFTSPFLEENNIPQEFLSEGITLNDESFNKVVKFIESEVITKDVKPTMIHDAGYYVRGKYKGKNFNIVNDVDRENKTGIYDKAKVLLEEINHKRK